MAGKIAESLDKIKNAVYGVEVRDAIHDSIKECYDDVTASKTLADKAAGNATSAANNANTAAGQANSAATNANNAASKANTSASNADASKKSCDDAVAALPNTVTNMFGRLGLVVVDGKLCVGVERE